MSHISTGILGALAVSLACGAVQFASGSDLGGSDPGNGRRDTSELTTSAVNRTAKADRLASAKAVFVQGQTLSFRVHSLPDMSVLTRLPVTIREDAVGAKPATEKPSIEKPSTTKASMVKPLFSQRRSAVACEPVVSVLTEVARLLEPGRCVT